MSLKENPLPPQVLALMYKDALVIPTAMQVDKAVHIPSLGGNSKHCLIVVHTPGYAYLEDDVLQFLTKILEAINFTLNDVAIVNVASTAVGYQQSIETWQPQVALLFGHSPIEFDMPVNFPEFKVQQVNGITFLHSPSLRECMDNKDLKAQLWQCLKSIFLNK